MRCFALEGKEPSEMKDLTVSLTNNVTIKSTYNYSDVCKSAFPN